ncbi:sulfite reductase subunit alpha [Cohaesibacter sp. CAU 1516]|uniref:diflavin oxidoreductase n=1 Tax=Cohaesibacter sp. CAU 1516 TaxID=2576038 RepID=UPI0010FD8D26|nr:flavodoxin domain-containing protein [Cohaesibacter sp. CAU 1516]TLP44275.1 sulfite reductase subunit alpha [Cohaesibacter sp. CAU 1516]
MTKQDPEMLARLATAIGQANAQNAPHFIPEDAPFDSEQRNWLNGLMTGLFAIAAAAKGDGAENEAGTALKILFGSQSGTAESLAKDLRKYAKTKGFEAEIGELDSVTPEDLVSLNHVVILAATFGEGEPTDNAKKFYEALMAVDAPSLPASLNFSVCGLGDSSYPHFNKVGTDLDARLAELGATRAAALVSCDVAYDEDYAAWKEAVFLSEPFASAAGAAGVADAEEAGPAFDKNHPFLASLMGADCLSGDGSAKRVNHVEISLAGGGEDLDYSVGDSLGVWPVNAPELANEILALLGLTGREVVNLKSGACKLRSAVLTKLDIVTVTPATLEAWGVERPFEDAHVIDLLRAGVPDLDAQAFVDGLRPLQPRLYSIASSPKKHPGEVHLTVGEVHYDLEGHKRQGVASTFLGKRLALGGSVGVYVQRSGHFHLPEDDSKPVIMIGPGTGIAPFHAFLEEREMRQATGDNWLFFGDQHQATDYLYRGEIEGWAASGLLTRLSLAWSRDSTEKVYVQHLIEKDGATFFDWLEAGAAIYICGDASRMASDVDKAIRRVIATHGKLDAAGVDAYMDQLTKDHRYQRDVY